MRLRNLVIRERICVICRKTGQQADLLRLTVDHISKEIRLNDGDAHLHGRSAYLCKNEKCLIPALKGHRLKLALEGRRIKGVEHKRHIGWPLEPQLIQVVTTMCTEASKTCQNTER